MIIKGGMLGVAFPEHYCNNNVSWNSNKFLSTCIMPEAYLIPAWNWALPVDWGYVFLQQCMKLCWCVMEDKVVVCWNNPAVTNYCPGKPYQQQVLWEISVMHKMELTKLFLLLLWWSLSCKNVMISGGRKFQDPPSSVWNPARLIVVTVANIIVEIEYGYYCFVTGIKQQSCPRLHQKQSERI